VENCKSLTNIQSIVVLVIKHTRLCLQLITSKLSYFLEPAAHSTEGQFRSFQISSKCASPSSSCSAWCLRSPSSLPARWRPRSAASSAGSTEAASAMAVLAPAEAFATSAPPSKLASFAEDRCKWLVWVLSRNYKYLGWMKLSRNYKYPFYPEAFYVLRA
jgi:hypothetical protein